MSYLLNDMDESYSFEFGIYFKTVPLYNHTTKSLLLRNFTFFKSIDLIENFLIRSKSSISYSKILEIFEMVALEIDRLYRIQLRSLQLTLRNPYTKTIHKILCLNFLACNIFVPLRLRFSRKFYVKFIVKLFLDTLISPYYLMIHVSTFAICVLLAPTLFMELYISSNNVEMEETWAKTKLHNRELDIQKVCDNLNMRIIDMLQKYERKNDFEFILTEHIMRKSCGSDEYVKVWGVNIRDIYDNIHEIPDSSKKLTSIFHDVNHGKRLFKLYNFIYSNIKT